MTDLPPQPPHDDDGASLAAEYALGLLGADDRRRAEDAMDRDPTFARAVAAWEQRLAPLSEEIEEVPPPGYVWSRIEVATFGRQRPAPGNSASLALWRWLSFGSMAVAAASLAAALFIARPTPPAPLRVAALAAQNGAPTFTVIIDPATSTSTILPLSSWSGGDTVPELWLVPASGAPISLGVYDRASPTRLSLPAGRLESLPPGATLAISAEPPGGSPTGQPTGPVIATGKVQTL